MSRLLPSCLPERGALNVREHGEGIPLPRGLPRYVRSGGPPGPGAVRGPARGRY